MNQSMKERCELFIQNRDTIKGAYKWDGDNMAIMGSVIYTGKMVAVNVDKMKEAEEILKKNNKLFTTIKIDEITRINSLLKEGVISEDEFNNLKSQILEKDNEIN